MFSELQTSSSFKYVCLSYSLHSIQCQELTHFLSGVRETCFADYYNVEAGANPMNINYLLFCRNDSCPNY